MNLCLHRPRVVLSILATIAVACGGDVGSEAGNSSAATGGTWSSTGGASSIDTPPSIGGGFALGGGIGVGGSIGGAGSNLPWRCTAGFDPGYTCASDVPPSSMTMYTFNPATGNCGYVSYNGCGGSTSGVFYNLGECQALCEQRPSDADCPLYIPRGAACSNSNALCTYGSSDCLCTVLGPYGCLSTDSRCSKLGLNSNSKARCNGETCTITQDIVIISSNVCACNAGIWSCAPATMSGGL